MKRILKNSTKALSLILSLLFFVELIPMRVFAEEISELQNSKDTVSNETVSEAEADIICEIKDRRDANTKVFLRSDGTKTAIVSASPMHYKNDGKWVDIDNTLEEKTVDGQKVLQNKSNSFDVNLPDDLSENNTVTVENNGYTLSFTLQSQELTKKFASTKAEIKETNDNNNNEKEKSQAYIASDFENNEAAVIYESAMDNTDIEYVVNTNGLKENIVISKAPENVLSYTYDIQADGLKAIQNDNNSIDFTDSEGAIIFTLPAPYMFDAENKISYEVEVKLKEKEGFFELTYIPSRDWLADENRKYPVTLDPAVQIPGPWGVDDTFVITASTDSDAANTNYGNLGAFLVNNITEVEGTKNAEAYFKLTQEDLFKNVKIVKASLTFDVNAIGTFAIKSISAGWNENTVTYNTKPALSNEYLNYFTLDTNGDPEVKTYDITQHYVKWQANELTDDYGVAVIPITEGCDLAGYSTESPLSGDYEPKIEVSFTEANNMNGVNDSHSFDIGRAGTVYVNDFSRNFYTLRNDISVGGNNLPVDISFHNNSNAEILLGNSISNYYDKTKNDSNNYGKGWLSNYNRFLDFSYMNLGVIAYCNEYGDVSYYKLDQTKSTDTLAAYTQINDNNSPPVGTVYTEDLSDEFYIYLKTTDGQKLYFDDSYGRLEKIEDNTDNKNSITIDYLTPKQNQDEYFSFRAISKITDGVGREYRFTYSDNTLTTDVVDKQLFSIDVYDASGNPVMVNGTNGDVQLKYNYSYDSGNKLIGVTYPDDNCISYGYGSGTSIISVTGVDGYKVNIGYNTFGLVNSISESINDTILGNFLEINCDSEFQNTFKYRYGSSLVNPYKTEIKQFNKDGRTISVRNGDNEFVGAVYTEKKIGDSNFTFLSDISDTIATLGTAGSLLTNGDFIQISGGLPSGNPVGWSLTNLTLLDVAYTPPSDLNCPTTNTIKINGAYNSDKYISQEVTPSVTLQKGDVLTLGGWVKANTVDLADSASFCGLKLIYSYNEKRVSGTTEPEEVIEVIPFENTNGTWMFKASEFTLKGAPIDNKVTVYAVYSKQFNTAYFANIKLTHTVAQAEEIVSPCGCANCAYGSYCPCKCAQGTTCNCEECTACICPACSHSLAEPCNCEDPTNCSCDQCQKCPCENCDHLMSEPCNCTDLGTCASGCGCTKCSCNNCNHRVGESCNCSDASTCTCADCQSPQQCNCENCEEYNCSCRCTSNCTCIQCKRASIHTADNDGNTLSSGKFDGVNTLQMHSTYTFNGNYPLSSCDSAGNMVQYSYNQDNGVLNSVTDAEGNTISYSYNAMRALKSVAQLVTGLTNGTIMTDTYGYADDRLSSITHNGFTYNFSYNDWGNPTAVQVGTQNLVTYSYGTNVNRDRIGSLTYGNGDTVTYRYDSDNNVTGISYDNGTTYAYEYTYTDGSISTVTDNQSELVTTYTDDGISVSKSGTVIYTNGNTGVDYTEAFEGKTYTYKSGDSDYTQTSGETVYSNSMKGAPSNSLDNPVFNLHFASTNDWFGRTKNSSITLKDAANTVFRGSISTDITYADYGADGTTDYISTYKNTVTRSDNTISGETTYSYTYDNNGNIKTISENGVLKYTYTYDEAGQLVRADDAVQNKTYTYTYNVGGNIVSKTEYAYTTGALGAAVNTINYTYDSTWKDKLASYNGNAIQYDTIGNVTNYAGCDYDWNGRLLNSIEIGTKKTTFKYNENGLRTKKTAQENGTTIADYTYIWDGDRLISQTWGSSSLYFIYNGNSYTPEGFVYNGTDVYMYTKNLQGDITGIVDNSGNACAAYTYDAWGKLLSSPSGIGAVNPFRYRGYYYDSETGLYYLRSRYYNPEWGRFLNADATEYLGANGGMGSYNLFAYCGNEPVDGIDVCGMMSFSLGGSIKFDTIKDQFYYNGSDPSKYRTLYNWSCAAGYAAKSVYPDGAAFYLHFLNGSGSDYFYDYAKAVYEDESICTKIFYYLSELGNAVKRLRPYSNKHYYIVSTPDGVAPSSMNWKLAIGLHSVAFFVDCIYNSSDNYYYYTAYLYAYDRYNFDAGKKFLGYINTDWNGWFVEAGMAKFFDSLGKMTWYCLRRGN